MYKANLKKNSPKNNDYLYPMCAVSLQRLSMPPSGKNKSFLFLLIWTSFGKRIVEMANEFLFFFLETILTTYNFALRLAFERA